MLKLRLHCNWDWNNLSAEGHFIAKILGKNRMGIPRVSFRNFGNSHARFGLFCVVIVSFHPHPCIPTFCIRTYEYTVMLLQEAKPVKLQNIIDSDNFLNPSTLINRNMNHPTNPSLPYLKTKYDFRHFHHLCSMVKFNHINLDTYLYSDINSPLP